MSAANAPQPAPLLTKPTAAGGILDGECLGGRVALVYASRAVDGRTCGLSVPGGELVIVAPP